MIKAAIAFKKAVAEIGFKKAVAEIKFGDFLIFRFFADALGLSDLPSKGVGKTLTDTQGATDSDRSRGRQGAFLTHPPLLTLLHLVLARFKATLDHYPIK